MPGPAVLLPGKGVLAARGRHAAASVSTAAQSVQEGATVCTHQGLPVPEMDVLWECVPTPACRPSRSSDG